MYFESQKFIYNTLKNDSTFMGLISNRLYDEPFTNEIYPYVILGDGASVKKLTHGKDGLAENFYITIFTKPYSLGWSQSKTIAARIRYLLHLKKFTCDDSNYENIICVEENETREHAGDYRNIDLIYSVILREA